MQVPKSSDVLNPCIKASPIQNLENKGKQETE